MHLQLLGVEEHAATDFTFLVAGLAVRLFVRVTVSFAGETFVTDATEEWSNSEMFAAMGLETIAYGEAGIAEIAGERFFLDVDMYDVAL